MPVPNSVSNFTMPVPSIDNTVLSSDGTTVIQTISATSVSYTLPQLNQMLVQAMNQAVQVNANISSYNIALNNINSNIANIQAMIASFPVATPPSGS